MRRIHLKARGYQSAAEVEMALRETIQAMGLEDENAGVGQCRSCYGWFITEPEEIIAEDPPVRQGRFWQIKVCDQCRRA